MHFSAWFSSRVFFTLIASLTDGGNYVNVANFSAQNPFTIVDIGSQDINGNMKTALYDSNLVNVVDVKYIGLDYEAAANVDVVISPKDKAYPFLPNSVDVIISSSALEHDLRFWVTFLRMLMVLKPGGFLYISVPYETLEHRHPVDSWRFYGDAGAALESWGQDNDYDISLVFTKTLDPCFGNPNRDNVMIFYKKTEYDTDASLQSLKNHFAGFMDIYTTQTHSIPVVISCLKSLPMGRPEDGILARFHDPVTGNHTKLTVDFELLPM